ncbi:MAG TPA: N-acetyltransferase [Trueperaceae bacterium]|nr:N-acetyltransferase [Trueperaceae bacterium]
MPDMLVKLYDLPKLAPEIEKMAAKGIIIRPCYAWEKIKAVNWVEKNYGQSWASEFEISFKTMPATNFIAIKAKKIVGFAVYDATRKNFFGPTGVLEEMQGLGIGRVLLIASLTKMYENGYAYAIIGGVGPVEFYQKTVGASLIDGSDPGIYNFDLD